MIAPLLMLSAAFALPTAEFARYYEKITGKPPADGLVTFAVDPAVSASGRDAYAITSDGAGAKVVGSNVRSVWYGLYDLLERRGGCRWFWDVDVVPQKDAIDLSGLNVKEEAHFEYRGIRYFAHRGLTRFQAEHWGPQEWTREIDWCLKRRLNVFMLRIGQDDLFQRAYPDVVPYPDAAQTPADAGKGFDNRTLFWPLDYRGRLRRNVQKYAFDRGLMAPEDFGTMTHWYSRTPRAFLEKMRPPFLPQATKSYSEPNGLVWDIRDDRWADAYWKLTQTAVEAYGQGRDKQELLHTPGLGERRCFTNRADNLNLKVTALKKFLDRAHREYPNARNLIAGWDFYYTWNPDEVRSLLKELDPARDIIWDYEGDATRDYRSELKALGGNNFTKWGVIGKFPYTYSMFLAYESALDVRANYPVIEARQRFVQNDPFCKGFILWPEASHTDSLALRFFTANAWSAKPLGHEAVLDEFCASRYGDQAEAMKHIWQRVIPMGPLLNWGRSYGTLFCGTTLGAFPHPDVYGPGSESRWEAALADVRSVFAALAEIRWEDEAIRRDAVDLARTALDRWLIHDARRFDRDFTAWQRGTSDGAGLAARAAELARRADRMADLLAIHTDYSLWESYLRLAAVKKVTNPDFPRVLLDNAANDYCRSHQYELARHLYAPRARRFAEKAAALLAAGDRTTPLKLAPCEAEVAALLARPLDSLKPTAPRTPESFRALMRTLAAASEPTSVRADGWAVIWAKDGTARTNAVIGVRQADGGWRYTVPAGDATGARDVDLHVGCAQARVGDDGYWVSQRGVLGHFTRPNGSWQQLRNWLTLPYYGMKTPQRSFLAVVEGMRFEYNQRVTSEGGVYRAFPRWRIEDTGIDAYEDMSVVVYDLPKGAGYNEMAKAFRRYKEARDPEIRPLKERAKTRPHLLKLARAVTVRQQCAAKPFKRPDDARDFTPETEHPVRRVCSFDEALENLKKLKARGVDDLSVVVAGWQTGGYDGRAPAVFPVEEAAGGEAGLRRLIAGAKALGYIIDAQENYTDCYTVSPLWDNGNIACLGTKGLDVNGSWSGGRAYNLCLRNAWDVQGFMPDSLRRAAGLGFWGAHYIDVFSSAFPYRCLAPGHAATRPQQLQYMLKAARLCRERFGGFASECCGDWLVGYLDYINYATPRIRDQRDARAAGRKTLEDKIVPFWELAFHDVVLSNPDRVTQGVLSTRDNLILVEFGGRPIFYSFGDRNIPAIAAAYEQFKGLRHLQLEEMTRHDELALGLVRVRYGNGETIYVNHAMRPQTADGITVPAQDFRLVGSGRAEQTSNGNNN